MIIDVTRLLGRLLKGRLPTGVDRVDIEYIRHYHPSSYALIRYRGRWLFFSFKESEVIFDVLVHAIYSASWKIRLMITKRWWLSWFTSLPTQNILLNISHSGLDDPAYAQKAAAYSLRTYYFIHDCIPLTYPEYSRPGEDIKHHNRLVSAISTCCGIIVNSQDTKEQINLFAYSMNLMLPPVAVAHLGYTPMKFTDSIVDIPKTPYFVIIGTIEARKNHLLLLNVWRNLVERLGDRTPKLMIIGQRGWESENAVDMIERCKTIHPYVEERERCSDSELFGLLKGSRALLFPTFAEGYGLPLIEALANGIPVIASDLSVFHEIVGNIPEYLDPIDGIGWENMIQEYTHDNSQIRMMQISRMISFSPVSWDNHFKVVDSFLESIEK